MSLVDIMLDLESMGVGNNPALIQVAAVAFDSETGDELGVFDEKVDLQSSIDAGLTITAGTIKFWMTHASVNQDTRNIVMSETGDHGKQGNNLLGVLHRFNLWYTDITKDDKKGVVWGNGSASDNVWLRSAYAAVSMTCPFNFRDDMCMRSLKTYAKRKGYKNDVVFVGNQHDGLDDCRHQIKDVMAIQDFLCNLNGGDY